MINFELNYNKKIWNHVWFGKTIFPRLCFVYTYFSIFMLYVCTIYHYFKKSSIMISSQDKLSIIVWMLYINLPFFMYHVCTIYYYFVKLDTMSSKYVIWITYHGYQKSYFCSKFYFYILILEFLIRQNVC